MMKTTWLGVAMVLLATGVVEAEDVPRLEDLKRHLSHTAISFPETCGFPGEERTLHERLVDCAKKNPTDHQRKSKNSATYLSLVARTESGIKYPAFYEVWRVAHPGHPEIDGLLIGDRHEGGFNWKEAKQECGDATKAEALLWGVDWRLPTGDELAMIGRRNQSLYNEDFGKNIKGNQLFARLPNMMHGNAFWSSLPAGDKNSRFPIFAWTLDGIDGEVFYHTRNNNALSVRCVGR